MATLDVDSISAVSNTEGDGQQEDVRLGGGWFRLLTGMVRINRPWRLVGRLQTVFVAAAATSAFGVFYASIWLMADTLSVTRLMMINLGAIAALMGWLIIHNGLWERAGGGGEKTRQPGLYNATMLISLFIGVACMYALLFVTTFLGAITIITAEYLETVLKHPVDVVDYLQIGWLASSLGTVAGALGSNFERESDIRSVAYGRRQLDRS